MAYKEYYIEQFLPSYEYIIENAYIYAWECDVFVQMKSGYHYEIEKKISRADFRADFRKSAKHHQLKEHKKETIVIPGGIQKSYLYPDVIDKYDYDIKELLIKQHSDGSAVYGLSSYLNIRKNIIPNSFYYLTPKGLLDVKEIPKYAGLLEYNEGEIVQIKPAKWLHKIKRNYDKILLDKYSWRLKSLLNQNELLHKKLDEFNTIYNDPSILNNQRKINF